MYQQSRLDDREPDPWVVAALDGTNSAARIGTSRSTSFFMLTRILVSPVAVHGPESVYKCSTESPESLSRAPRPKARSWHQINTISATKSPNK